MRLLPALALSAGLALAGCQHPDGSTDWGSTLALGAGAAALVGIAALAANDDDRRHDRRRHRHRHGGRHRRHAWRGHDSYRRRR